MLGWGGRGVRSGLEFKDESLRTSPLGVGDEDGGGDLCPTPQFLIVKYKAVKLTIIQPYVIVPRVRVACNHNSFIIFK